jgi:hypothetical protein
MKGERRMNLFTVKRLGRTLLLSAVLAAGAFCWTGCGGDDSDSGGGGSGPNTPPGGDVGWKGGDVVGEWLFYSITYFESGETLYLADKNPNSKQVVSFEPSGSVVSTYFTKVEGLGFWIDMAEANGGWRVEDSTFYSIEDGTESGMPFSVSGDEFTYKRCGVDYEEYHYCAVMTLKKVDLAEFKNSLGTVYTADPALNGDWMLPAEEDYGSGANLNFYSGEVSGDGLELYIGEGIYNGYYYTNDSTLYLIGKDCDWDEDTGEEHCTVTDPVTKTYGVIESDGDKTLKIDGDDWKVHEGDYSSDKSRRNKSLVSRGKDKGVFPKVSKKLSAKR